MRQETWSHKSGKQLKQRSHLGLRCIELSELRRDLQIFLPPWLMTGDWGIVPQALTSVIKVATSAKCNWADCLGSSKHYVIGLIKVIKRGRRGGGSWEYRKFGHFSRPNVFHLNAGMSNWKWSVLRSTPVWLCNLDGRLKLIGPDLICTVILTMWK